MMADKVLILGGTGQIGQVLINLLGDRVIAPQRNEIDLLDTHYIQKLDALAAIQPITAVINTAAYTQVDKAESEPEQAFRVNGEAVGELAAWCKNRNIPLLHFSTDYVFDGEKHIRYFENDTTRPINVYGQSKLAGEQAIMAQGDSYLILRTSLVYSTRGNNFFTRIMNQLYTKKSLDVVDDQMSSPTYTPHVADAALDLLAQAMQQKPFPSGIYHLCGQGETTRYEFAETLFALVRAKDSNLMCARINAVKSAVYPMPARRPLNSRLNCDKTRIQFGIVLPTWQTGLNECFGEYYANYGLQNSRP